MKSRPFQAAALQHDGLAVAADVGHVVHPVRLTHHHTAMVLPFQGPVIVHMGHHQLVADVPGPLLEEEFLLQFEHFFVEIPVDGELGYGRGQMVAGDDFGHLHTSGKWQRVEIS